MGHIKDALGPRESPFMGQFRKYVAHTAGEFASHQEQTVAAALGLRGSIVQSVFELARSPQNGNVGIKPLREIPQQIVAGFDAQKGSYTFRDSMGDAQYMFSVGAFAGDITVNTQTPQQRTQITSYVDVNSPKIHSPTLDIKRFASDTTATRVITFQANYHNSELHPDIVPLQVTREEGQFGVHVEYTDIDGDGMVHVADNSPLFVFHRARRLQPIRLPLEDGQGTVGFSISATEALVSVTNPDGKTITLPRHDNIRVRLDEYLHHFPTMPGSQAA